MPTHNDETLHDRYAREHADHMARLAKMTPEQIAEMELSLHNAMAELDRLRDQQANRIGELEGLLRAESARVDFLDAYIVTADAPDTGKVAMLADSGTLRECIDFALSAGKEGE